MRLVVLVLIMVLVMVLRMLMCDCVGVRGVGLVTGSVDHGGGVRSLTPASTTPIPVLTSPSTRALTQSNIRYQPVRRPQPELPVSRANVNINN